MGLVSYWYCQRCRGIIAQEDLNFAWEEELHYWLDDCPVETYVTAHCPCCGSEEIDEAEYCEVCGEPFAPEDLEDGICKECMEKENRPK